MATDAHPAASGNHGGWANRPGPRMAYLTAAVAALAAAVVVVLLITGGRGSTKATNALGEPVARHYGQDPKWLKIPEPAAVTTVVASAATPYLKAMEGYPVLGKLSGGSVDINAEGPAVPSWAMNQASNGQWKPGQKAPGSFEVTFTDPKGTVPLSASQFTVINYLGQITHPPVTNADGGPIPSELAPGQTVHLKLATSVPEGDGALRWAPNGKRILVSFFWTLELS
jgi:hypothetical protein